MSFLAFLVLFCIDSTFADMFHSIADTCETYVQKGKRMYVRKIIFFKVPFCSDGVCMMSVLYFQVSPAKCF